MWSLEKKLEPLGESVTRNALATELKIDAGYVSKIIHEIKSISDDYVVTRSVFPREKWRKRGAPFRSYQLNHARLATRPDTAFVLLKLLAFEREKPYQITRSKFVRQLMGTCGLTEQFIEGRINWAIETSYMYSQDPQYIYPHERITYEKQFLERLETESEYNKGVSTQN